MTGHRLVALLLLLSLALEVQTGFAQGNRSGRENVRLSGTLQGLRPGMMQVASDDGVQWIFQIQAKPQDIIYQATAEPEWVRPGMLVRFSGRFNKQGEAEQPISEITVFTPREGSRIGIFPESALNTEGLFESPDAEPTPSDGYSSYLVSGRFMGMKAGKMQVVAGRSLQVDVAENVEVQVDVSDYTLAKPGDKVEVGGWFMRGQPGRGMAERLSITAAEPLTAEAIPTRGRRGAAGAAGDAAAGEPDAETDLPGPASAKTPRPRP